MLSPSLTPSLCLPVDAVTVRFCAYLIWIFYGAQLTHFHLVTRWVRVRHKQREFILSPAKENGQTQKGRRRRRKNREDGKNRHSLSAKYPWIICRWNCEKETVSLHIEIGIFCSFCARRDVKWSHSWVAGVEGHDVVVVFVELPNEILLFFFSSRSLCAHHQFTHPANEWQFVRSRDRQRSSFRYIQTKRAEEWSTSFSAVSRFFYF